MRYLAIGEPLLEFSARRDAPSTFDRRPGGDTLNTAIYLSRLIGAGKVGYLSCLGDDPQSQWLRQSIAGEGIDVSTLAAREGGRPGLSFISTDAEGERSFVYWRDQSPFRSHFDDAEVLKGLDAADTIFLSAVTLAVLLPRGRANLLAALSKRRDEGARIVLDTNYRRALWSDAATARQVISDAAALATLVMPSLDDVCACFDVTGPDAAMREMMALTDAEIVLTTGGEAVLHRPGSSDQATCYALPPPVAAMDTTGAGDSFDAAFLVARDAGATPAKAIEQASRLAAVVVAHPGAVIPIEAMPIAVQPGVVAQ